MSEILYDREVFVSEKKYIFPIDNSRYVVPKRIVDDSKFIRTNLI